LNENSDLLRINELLSLETSVSNHCLVIYALKFDRTLLFELLLSTKSNLLCIKPVVEFRQGRGQPLFVCIVCRILSLQSSFVISFYTLRFNLCNLRTEVVHCISCVVMLRRVESKSDKNLSVLRTKRIVAFRLVQVRTDFKY